MARITANCNGFRPLVAELEAVITRREAEEAAGRSVGRSGRTCCRRGADAATYDLLATGAAVEFVSGNELAERSAELNGRLTATQEELEVLAGRVSTF